MCRILALIVRRSVAIRKFDLVRDLALWFMSPIVTLAV